MTTTRKLRGKAALVTGCSSGIGLSTALALARRGYEVWAGVRRDESLRDLERVGRRLFPDAERGAGRWRPVRLDVTLPGEVAAVMTAIAESGTPLRAVVNNAGYGQFGALEDLTEEEFRAQWEINVAGLWRTTRAAIPLLRAHGPGATIVQISSILGKITLPFGGAYSSSKFAVEALSDAWRVELAPWGIRVVVIEPGPIRSRFSENAMNATNIERFERSLYANTYKAVLRYYKKDKPRHGELPASVVARVILNAVESPRPRSRYLITAPAKLAAFGRWALPDRAIDALARFYMRLQSR